MPDDLGPEEPAPDEVRFGGQQGGSSLRRSRRHARSPHAASRHVTSLRRSQQRLIGGEHPTTVAADEVSPTPAVPNLSDDVDATRSTRARLRASLLHPGRGQILAAIILFIVGAAGVMQFRINATDETYASARREDLIQLLDGLSTESRRLEGEIAQLEETRSDLRSGADTQRVARTEAERQLGELSILAGTAPAEGRGIRMRIADPNSAVDSRVLLDAVEEMRDAGAEVIEVNNTIRVVASTWFGSDARGLVIDDKPVSRPITLEVIGEPHDLEEAARFRGGIVSEITGPKIGGQVQLEQVDRVVIESLHASRENQYARPAAPPPTPR
ncbi:MAG: hypothetical protein K0R13_725 [Propionibacteriaceae bacterium]|nr:hypothetical protein [Propionibacteriaceae bacterium]